MRVNPVLPHDYNSDGWHACEGPQTIQGPAYFAGRPEPDYSPRDKRQWLRACRCVGCPVERCLTMREPG